MLALRDDREGMTLGGRSERTSGGTHAEYTVQMRSYGMYVYGPRREKVLLNPLRGREKHDNPELPLWASGLRRQGMNDAKR